MKPSIPLSTLIRWLSTGRPYASKEEFAFQDELAALLESTDLSPTLDKGGNLHVDARHLGNTRTMFSAHTDTAASKAHVKVLPRWDAKTQCLHAGAGAPILGADNSAGVWLLCNMLKAGVGGYYVFHTGEERGGIGSSWLSENYHLPEFDACIAFDRKATSSVITHQFCGRCCSDAFGDALAESLMAAAPELIYGLDDTGSFTDTANYTTLIPECTNVSVGYYDEHTARERLYVPHLLTLLNAAVLVEWSALPVKRDVNDVDDVWGRFTYPTEVEFEDCMFDGECLVCQQDWNDIDTWLENDLVPKDQNYRQLDRCPDPYCSSNSMKEMHDEEANV